MMALARIEEQQLVEWNSEQRAIIRDQFANGASDNEFAALLETARVRGLDPFKKQVFFVKRWDSAKRREVWATQVSIDGLRGIAERTGRYDGQDEPEYAYDDRGQIVSCKVRVYRKDHTRPAVGVAFFVEYVQKTKEGSPSKFWTQMPHVMIAKCAEALAIRKGFPEQTSGLYTPEEMAQASSGVVNYDGEVVEARPLRTVPEARPTPAPESGETTPDAVARLGVRIFDAMTLTDLDAVARDIKAAASSLSKDQIAGLRADFARAKERILAAGDLLGSGYVAEATAMREPGEEG